MNIQRNKIAIVGGGSVGISFLLQLVENAINAEINDQIEILLFEPQNIIGPGYAYQADFKCNLLNTRADSMSIKSNEKVHFISWLKANESLWKFDYPDVEILPESFLPRSLFGLYLANMYELAIKQAKQHNILFYHIKDEVIDAIPINNHNNLLDTKFHGVFIIDHLVICMGNMPSKPINNLSGISGYFNSPYPCKEIVEQIPTNASVCIVGTSLSAIDAVLSLKEHEHNGNIICVSRNGRLPSVRGNLNQPLKLKQLTRGAIDEIAQKNGGYITLWNIAQVLLNEYTELTGEKCDIDLILNAKIGMHDYIAQEISQSNSMERIWQSIIYATNSIIDYLWHKLSDTDKYIFNKYFRSQWLSYRVSFPLANAQKIRELLSTDQLHVFGGVNHISYDNAENVFLTHINDRRNGLDSIIKTKYVINATSYSIDVETNDNIPLVTNLLKRNLAVSHKFGGFAVDYDTGFLLNSSGVINPSIRVLGSLTTGVYFWTNAMDVNARLALNQVKYLVRDLKDKYLVSDDIKRNYEINSFANNNNNIAS